MTEAEWLVCPYPTRLLEGKRGFRRSSRKLRLVACACYRRVWHLLSEMGRSALEVTERFADGEATAKELTEAQPPFVRYGNVADNGMHFATAPTRLFRSWVTQAFDFAAWSVAEAGPAHEVEVQNQCHLIRDVFGLRFKSIATEPAWLTETTVALAAGIYAERAFDRMPILADALEEAGCDNADILIHCRSDGPHVRGCWVVDLLLGKE